MRRQNAHIHTHMVLPFFKRRGRFLNTREKTKNKQQNLQTRFVVPNLTESKSRGVA
jgi:hypothetical protein